MKAGKNTSKFLSSAPYSVWFGTQLGTWYAPILTGVNVLKILILILLAGCGSEPKEDTKKSPEPPRDIVTYDSNTPATPHIPTPKEEPVAEERTTEPKKETVLKPVEEPAKEEPAKEVPAKEEPVTEPKEKELFPYALTTEDRYTINTLNTVKKDMTLETMLPEAKNIILKGEGSVDGTNFVISKHKGCGYAVYCSEDESRWVFYFSITFVNGAVDSIYDANKPTYPEEETKGEWTTDDEIYTNLLLSLKEGDYLEEADPKAVALLTKDQCKDTYIYRGPDLTEHIQECSFEKNCPDEPSGACYWIKIRIWNGCVEKSYGTLRGENFGL